MPGHFWQADTTDPQEFVPTIQSDPEEPQHPPVGAFAECFYSMALFNDMAPQPPTITHGVPISPANERPTASKNGRRQSFGNEHAHLKYCGQQEDVLSILQNDQQAVSIGVVARCGIGSELDDASASSWICRSGASMMQSGPGHGDGLVPGQPHAPGKVHLVGIHEEFRVEASDLMKQIPAN